MKIKQDKLYIEFNNPTFDVYYNDKVIGYFRNISSGIKALINHKKIKFSSSFVKDYLKLQEKSREFYNPIQSALNKAYYEKFKFE